MSPAGTNGEIRISIIVPSHLHGREALSLLGSLRKQSDPPSHEILVIANPPDANLRAALAHEVNVHYFELGSTGANSARNIGLERARGEIVLFLDADCSVADPRFLRRHYDIHLQNPSLSGIGGNYVCPPGAGAVRRAYHDLQCEWQGTGPHPGYHCRLLLGGNMSFKRAALGEERFDEALVYGGTETEFIFRLADLGHKMKFFPELSVEHSGHLGFFSLLWKFFRQGCGAAFMVEKNFSRNRPVIAKRPFGPPRSYSVALISSLCRFHFRAGWRWGRKHGSSRPRRADAAVGIVVHSYFAFLPWARFWCSRNLAAVLEALIQLRRLR